MRTFRPLIDVLPNEVLSEIILHVPIHGYAPKVVHQISTACVSV
jgi:hypothetical protein